jgi:hypothetical protein
LVNRSSIVRVAALTILHTGLPNINLSQQWMSQLNECHIADDSVRAALVWDDTTHAGRVVVAGLDELDAVDLGYGNRSWWIIIVRPGQTCKILGRCTFYYCYERS